MEMREEDSEWFLDEIPTMDTADSYLLENHGNHHHHLEIAFDRLNLSTIPLHHQSPFFVPATHAYDSIIDDDDAPFGSYLAIDSSVGVRGFSPLSFQQTEGLSFQEPITRPLLMSMRAHSAAQGFESYGLLQSIPSCVSPRRSLLNRERVTASVPNECGDSCCLHNPRNRNRLDAPREFIPTRRYSNGNGFQRDVELHLRQHYPNTPREFTPTRHHSNGNGFQRDAERHWRHHNPNYSCLDELRGLIVAAAKDKDGCQFLKKKVDEGRKEDIEMIFLEAKDRLCELMMDPFGNYLVQMLFEVCNEEQRKEVLLTVARNECKFFAVCRNSHGTRAIQKLLMLLTSPEQISFVISALAPGTVILTNDNNGQHVIVHCLKHFSKEDNKYLLNAIADHCVEIATDKSGCCVLKYCVENTQEEFKMRIVMEITASALHLAQDAYGNYVVQSILDLRVRPFTAALLKQLEGNFVNLSMQKFSSNVVEKCLKESEEHQSTQIIRELLSSPNFMMLLKDAYGNYVIQSALAISKGLVYNALVDQILMEHLTLRSHLYGRRVLAQINARNSVPCRGMYNVLR